MRLFLASFCGDPGLKHIEKCLYALESFYYIEKWELPYIHRYKSFLLDSGAFTFLSNSKSAVNWDDYVRRYINFINRHDIQLFFEMDIDKIVGLRKVEEYRSIIEKSTGKRSIPVWHKSRGLQYWKDLCMEYDYVAIGGIAIKDIPQRNYKYFSEFIKIANRYHTKVHGLGFTGRMAPKYGFYSVDSTTWKSGRRFGQIHIFNGRSIEIVRPPGKRLINYKIADQHNFEEWIKYQRYLDHM
jgi:hypothetical protein